MSSKLVFFFLTVLLIVYVGFNSLLQINRGQISPNNAEIELLQEAYGNIDINTLTDLIRIQNKVLEINKHELVNTGQFILKENLYKGECYDRSIILQKILIYNKISVRPVFIYFGGPTNTAVDIFSSKLKSHSIFEFKWGSNYYVMRTNTKMVKCEKIDEYLKEPNWSFPKSGVHYLRYVSNRNGRFLVPNWLPDIYYINF